MRSSRTDTRNTDARPERRTTDFGRVAIGYGWRAASGWLTAALLIAVTGAVSAVAYPYCFKVFLDGLTGHDHAATTAGALTTAATLCLTWVAAMLSAQVGANLTERMVLFVSVRVAELVNAVPGIGHLEHPAYLDQLHLLQSDRKRIDGAPRQAVGMLQTLLRIAGTAALLLTVYPPLVLVLVAGVFPVLAERRAGRIRDRAQEGQAEGQRLVNKVFALGSSVAPAKELRIFGLVPEIRRRHRRLASSVTRSVIRSETAAAATASLGWLSLAAVCAVCLVLVVRRASAGAATPGQVLMAVTLLMRAQGQAGQLAEAGGKLLDAATAIGRLVWLERFAARVVAHDGAVDAPTRLSGGITLDRVSFRYPGAAADALSDIRLTLPAGACVAVVGDNGSGKTTLVKLLLRMHEPSSGTIMADGLNLRDIATRSWHSAITASFQDPARLELEAGTAVGVGDLPRAGDAGAVSTALRRAAAEELITELPDGLATRLGRSFPDGRELSGGQWQRLGLGRTMMREAPLLMVLDEPTASMDPLTEQALFEHYVGAARRTASASGGVSVLVSHRFATVRSADLIVVLSDGRVVESGTHAELMTNRGTYARLFEAQARAYR